MRKLYVLILTGLMFQLQAQPPAFKFVPDTGIRIDSVSIAHATLINDTLFLFYNYHLFDGTSAKGVGIATESSDWLEFDTNYLFFDYNDYFIRYRMPDSIYRKFHIQDRDIISFSSVTGRYFDPDTGIRYTLPPSDSVMGVSTYISAPDGSVHLFYNAMGQQDIACRHAISYPGDNGWNFHFTGGNVFGDSLYAEREFYVDPNSLLNADGSITVYLMNQHGDPVPPAGRTGYICSFTSYDNGQTFDLDRSATGDTVRFKFDDFDAGYGFSEKVYSLNDPKAVILPDGRYRIYITALLKDSLDEFRRVIVSATSAVYAGMKKKGKTSNISIYPNPSKGNFNVRCPGIDLQTATLSLFNVNGKEIKINYNINANGFVVQCNDIKSGIYFLKVASGDSVFTKKVVVGK